MEQIQPGIFKSRGNLYTKAGSTESVYGENFLTVDDIKYRNWNPNRSKAGAAVMNGMDLEIEQDDMILYLGAASGTTVSHFSDIVEKGFIVGVEYSDTVIRDLVTVAEQRENIAPVLGDARKPEEYSEFIEEADIIFQDISQRDQPEIFMKNCEKFLAEGGTGLLAVKARSISSTKDKNQIFENVKQKLAEKFVIVDEVELEPYEKEHLMLKVKKK